MNDSDARRILSLDASYALHCLRKRKVEDWTQVLRMEKRRSRPRKKLIRILVERIEERTNIEILVGWKKAREENLNLGFLQYIRQTRRKRGLPCPQPSPWLKKFFRPPY